MSKPKINPTQRTQQLQPPKPSLWGWYPATPATAAPRATQKMVGLYDPRTDQHTTRPGATNALALPSRMGDRLIYRDGTVGKTMHGVRA